MTFTLPPWTTASSFIEDRILYCKHPSSIVAGAELSLACRIITDSETGTVHYVEESSLCLPDWASDMTLRQARMALDALQELLAILQRTERRGGRCERVFEGTRGRPGVVSRATTGAA